MGNCSEDLGADTLQLDRWSEVSRDKYSVILKHPNKRLIVQKWNSEGMENMNIYNWRLKVTDSFLPIIQQINNEKLLVSGGTAKKQHQKISIVITEPLTRLSELSQFTSGECALFLKGVLKGLKILCEKFGWFELNSEMVFVDQKGQPVVWIHPNIAMNTSYHKLSIGKLNQETFVQKAYSLLRKKMEHQQVLDFPIYPINFRQADQWLRRYIELKCPQLTKIYSNRVQYSLSEERILYREASIALPKLVDRLLTRNSSTQPSEMMHVKQYSGSSGIKQSKEQIQSAQQLQETLIRPSGRDPDDLLLELIEQYSLDRV